MGYVSSGALCTGAAVAPRAAVVCGSHASVVKIRFERGEGCGTWWSMQVTAESLGINTEIIFTVPIVPDSVHMRMRGNLSPLDRLWPCVQLG